MAKRAIELNRFQKAESVLGEGGELFKTMRGFRSLKGGT
jgi:hypothetical protein